MTMILSIHRNGCLIPEEVIFQLTGLGGGVPMEGSMGSRYQIQTNAAWSATVKVIPQVFLFVKNGLEHQNAGAGSQVVALLTAFRQSQEKALGIKSGIDSMIQS